LNLYNIFKNLAFNVDAEFAHNQSISLLSKFPETIGGLYCIEEKPRVDTSITLNDGNRWSFPVGLAAGLDKNAEAIDFFTKIPFGCVEVGTVTPRAQQGNPKPRMFRLKEEESLLNRMGFNNSGSEQVLENIKRCNKHGKVLGVNLGKNKDTPQDRAPEDYKILFEKFSDCADYLVVNVSSPNTPGLRDLQNIDSLKLIFDALIELRQTQKVPLYLKISPDLSMDDLPGIIEMARTHKLAGIIATNTTIRKDIGLGGISGKLLQEKARNMRAELLRLIEPGEELEIIGVGGISSFSDLLEFWQLGGKVCQIYTSFIYQGPQVLLSINNEIIKLMEREKVYKLSELIESVRK
jgi:dihydroorotate dehydrogenase